MNIITDFLNGYSLTDLKLLILQLLSATFLGMIFYFLFRKKNTDLTFFNCLVIPLLVAFVVALTRNSAPLSISALGIFILFSRSIDQSKSSIAFIVLSVAGFGTGSGNILVTTMFMFLFVFPLFFIWQSQKSNSET